MEKVFKEKVDRFEFSVNTKTESNGVMTCHIPAYDIYFGAKDEEMVRKKSKAMVKSWINFYNIK